MRSTVTQLITISLLFTAVLSQNWQLQGTWYYFGSLQNGTATCQSPTTKTITIANGTINTSGIPGANTPILLPQQPANSTTPTNETETTTNTTNTTTTESETTTTNETEASTATTVTPMSQIFVLDFEDGSTMNFVINSTAWDGLLGQAEMEGGVNVTALNTTTPANESESTNTTASNSTTVPPTNATPGNNFVVLNYWPQNGSLVIFPAAGGCGLIFTLTNESESANIANTTNTTNTTIPVNTTNTTTTTTNITNTTESEAETPVTTPPVNETETVTTNTTTTNSTESEGPGGDWIMASSWNYGNRSSCCLPVSNKISVLLQSTSITLDAEWMNSTDCEGLFVGNTSWSEGFDGFGFIDVDHDGVWFKGNNSFALYYGGCGVYFSRNGQPSTTVVQTAPAQSSTTTTTTTPPATNSTNGTNGTTAGNTACLLVGNSTLNSSMNSTLGDCQNGTNTTNPTGILGSANYAMSFVTLVVSWMIVNNF